MSAVSTERIKRTARVIHCRFAKNEQLIVTLITGDQEYEIEWLGEAPKLGDLYQIGSNLKITQPKVKLAETKSWDSLGDAMRWRTRNAQGISRMEILYKRQIIKRSLQEYFFENDFLEVDAPLLVRGTTPDLAINSFRLGERYLITSSEHQIKRLEVGGFERIYTLTKNFREADGEGKTHNPEFTMLEWDRVGGTLGDVESDAEQFITKAHFSLNGNGPFYYGKKLIDLSLPWPRQTVASVIREKTGISLNDFEAPDLRRAVIAAGIKIHDEWSDDNNFLFSVLMDRMQQGLGWEKPIFVTEWPSFMTSMAPQNSESLVSERSELYIAGLELSNGFPSVTNYEEQKRGLDQQIQRRIKDNKTPIVLDENFLMALRQGLPACTGMALGFDRLVMILTNQDDIRSVMPFSWDEV